MQRFDLEYTCGDQQGMVKHDGGEWVQWDDHQAELAQVRQELEAERRRADELEDAFLSTGGMWAPCGRCKQGSLVSLGECRGEPGSDTFMHLCGACVAVELREQIAALQRQLSDKTIELGQWEGRAEMLQLRLSEREQELGLVKETIEHRLASVDGVLARGRKQDGTGVVHVHDEVWFGWKRESKVLQELLNGELKLRFAHDLRKRAEQAEAKLRELRAAIVERPQEDDGPTAASVIESIRRKAAGGGGCSPWWAKSVLPRLEQALKANEEKIQAIVDRFAALSPAPRAVSEPSPAPASSPWIPVGERPKKEHCRCAFCCEARNRMIVCEWCGNKRCPHAAYHGNHCTRSNAPNQPGSDFCQPLPPPPLGENET